MADAVADSVASTPIARKLSSSLSGYPYRKARVVQSDGTWYILFYAWDKTKRELVRKRVAKNELTDCPSNQRQSIARKYIDDINYLLHHDAVVERKAPASTLSDSDLGVDFTHFTFIDAINYAMAHKRDVAGVKKSTTDEYISTRTTVEDFYANKKIPLTYKLKHVNKVFVEAYLDYMKTVRKSSNKTYNCRVAILHSTCQVILKKDPTVFKKSINPFANITFLKTETRKHAAYTDEQMKLFAEAMTKKGEPHVLLFMQFMFYTLARPEELRHLKVGHIRIEERRILFLSQSAKTSIEQYVGINDRFAEIIINSRILEFPQSNYVFCNPGTRAIHCPGERQVSVSYFYKRVKKYILSLGLKKINPNYTMYSFKHSGAISLYKATKDIKLLQQQCRHQTIDQTNTYLRDIGLFSDFDKLNTWNGPL